MTIGSSKTCQVAFGPLFVGDSGAKYPIVGDEEYPLFAPGRFYDGSSDRSVVEGWRLRLERYIRQ